MKNRILKNYVNDTKGMVSFEAIWLMLFLSFFFAPTAYLYRTSETFLHGVWAQRTAARNNSINSSCSSSWFNPLPVTGGLGSHAITATVCGSQDGQNYFSSQNDYFWKKMDTAVQSPFSDFNRDMKDEAEHKTFKGDTSILTTKMLDLGDGNGDIISNFRIPGTYTESNLLVPNSNFWTFDKVHWREGHDKIVWSKFTKNQRLLFPEVYPSAEGTGGAGDEPSGSQPTSSHAGDASSVDGLNTSGNSTEQTDAVNASQDAAANAGGGDAASAAADAANQSAADSQAAADAAAAEAAANNP
ncbi:hypothetical protein [Amylibacter marinus]|nr:hypothetical protein [Amylibacter marinus]